jgi:uncharacterized membrane protein YhaH (DUF805 family)
MAATLWELVFVTVCAVVALAGLALVRRTRLHDSDEDHMPGVLWAALYGGAVITVAFTYCSMTAEVVALIALVVFLVIALSKPFAGAVRLSPEPFQRQLALIAAQSAR